MGDTCCPFWREKNLCAGWPGNAGHECTANEDGTHCLLFPQTAEERFEYAALRHAELQRKTQ